VRSAYRIARAMEKMFMTTAGLSCDSYVSRINTRGAQILWVKRA
jgi:hypothetical protein